MATVYEHCPDHVRRAISEYQRKLAAGELWIAPDGHPTGPGMAEADQDLKEFIGQHVVD